jgi:hypothetical protein
MRHDALNTPCCLLASEEDIEQDPDVYTRCDECGVAGQIDGLCAENLAAWRQYREAVTRFAVDTQTVALVIQRCTADLDRDEFADLMERFAVLYNALCPPRQQKTSE